MVHHKNYCSSILIYCILLLVAIEISEYGDLKVVDFSNDLFSEVKDANELFMKLKLLQSMAGINFSHNIGDIIDVNDDARG